jgi:hypothetical protein
MGRILDCSAIKNIAGLFIRNLVEVVILDPGLSAHHVVCSGVA